MSYDNKKLLRKMIRECILLEQAGGETNSRGREIFNYRPDVIHKDPSFINLVGTKAPPEGRNSLEGVGIINSLVTPLWDVVASVGNLGFTIVSGIGSTVVNLLGNVFRGIGFAGSDTVGKRSSKISI